MSRAMDFVAGLLFGVGLLLSGMTDPGKVIGFLDLAGAWDPSLAFVMAGAIGVGFFAFRAAHGRRRSLLGAPMQLPGTKAIDWRLLAGSAVFGVGWGLSGFCPGPAVVAAGAGYWQALLYTLAMLAGMAVHELSVRLAPGAVVQE
ncbi:MAG: hypothetical protein NDJ19_10530 [Ramlibacter sp.]|nr:hypothetical protein [Ramlibacter sp.]